MSSALSSPCRSRSLRISSVCMVPVRGITRSHTMVSTIKTARTRSAKGIICRDRLRPTMRAKAYRSSRSSLRPARNLVVATVALGLIGEPRVGGYGELEGGQHLLDKGVELLCYRGRQFLKHHPGPPRGRSDFFLEPV